MAANETVRATPAPLDTVRAQQIRLLYADGDAPIYVTAVVGALLAAFLVYLKLLTWQVAGVWGGALALQAYVRVALRARHVALRPTDAHWRRWAWGFTAAALLGGLVWGVGALWLLVPGRLDLQLLLIVVLMAVVYSSISGVASYLPAFYALAGATFAPPVAWFAEQGDAAHFAGAVLLVLWAPTVVILARRYNASLVQAVRLRVENVTLVEDVIDQKALADQADVARSQFISLANRELRQPVHTLGLLIGALRSHRLPGRSIELIDQMDRLIADLEARFASLPDGPAHDPILDWTPEAETPTSSAGAALRSGLVLAIDEDEHALFAMTELLQGWGYQVVTATSGPAAIAMLENQPGPDLIVCDDRLGGDASVVEAIQALREEFGRGVPVMVVTAASAGEGLRQASSIGLPVLRKPLAYTRLRAAVASLIRRPVRVSAAE